MPKNMVICFDGTNNEFGSNNTNVVRLAEVLNRNPTEQILYYDPGVGTFPEPGYVTKLGKKLSEIMGLAFGLGLTRKIGEAYSFLMDNYTHGDAVYMFGFSRGAYTARALAGVIFQFGLLPNGSYNLVPYILRLSKEINRLNRPKPTKGRDYWEITRGFRATFARTAPGAASKVDYVRVHFLGVWDTVSSVGWVWDPTHFPYTAYNPAVEVFRHAVAIDERRWFFRQNLWDRDRAPKDQDIKEWWFPGVHCDVGGGYPESEGGLWQIPFLWILQEAEKAGLKIDAKKANEVLKRTPVEPPSWANQKHESLDWKWWLAEFFPKFPKTRDPGRHWPRMGLFRFRFIPEEALMHASALQRFRKADLNYKPGNWSSEFQMQVADLPEVPETLPYSGNPEQMS